MDRVVVTHWVHPEVTAYLASFCDPVVPGPDQGVWPRPRVAELAAGARGLIVSMADQVDDAFLAGCPRLRVVSATLKGYDNFDADACARRGVWLTILPDLLTAPTAELTVGLIIGLLRRVADGDRHVRSGAFAGWRPRWYGATLHGATAGIVGMGEVGQAVAARLAPFGTRIVYYDRRPLPAAAQQRLRRGRRAAADVARGGPPGPAGAERRAPRPRGERARGQPRIAPITLITARTAMATAASRATSRTGMTRIRPRPPVMASAATAHRASTLPRPTDTGS
jgi:phosphonate dehydrogenase